MQLNVQIDKSGGLFNQPQAIIQAGLDRFITAATMLLSAEVQKRTPQGVMGYQGGLISTIGPNTEITGKGTPLVKGVVAHGSVYGDVVDRGRTPGKGLPPQGSLVRWLEVKLGLSEKDAQRIEFVVRRKIGNKGFAGQLMFEKALLNNLGRLEMMADAEGLTIAKELN